MLAAYAVTVVEPAASAASVQQAYVKASNARAGSVFGISVAVSGDTMLIGAPLEGGNAPTGNGNPGENSASGSGAAYVFVRDGTNWAQQAYLKSANPGLNDFFGRAVALSGDTAVIGVWSEDSNATGVNGDATDNSATNSGAVCVFARNGTNWFQQAYLKASNTAAFDIFGGSVAVSGDTIVVGALWEDSDATGINGDLSGNGATNSGAAYVFVRDGTKWSQQACLKASNTGAYDQFGGSVSIFGDTIVVGALSESSSATGVNGDQNDNNAVAAGAAYVFTRTGTNWNQQAYVKASNCGAGDNFGSSVAVAGETLVVGAGYESSNAAGVNGDQNDDTAPWSGAAYVFARAGTNWVQQAYLKASNSEANDFFGCPVAISGDLVVVGATDESSRAIGLNGDQADNSASQAGAAYAFVRHGTNWSQAAYFKASNTDAKDFFGLSVAVSGDTVAVGAGGEASNATGVNGDQGDNSSECAGAAYVFAGLGHGPRMNLVRNIGEAYILRFRGAPNVTYRVQRAFSVSGPWETIGSLTAPASGFLEYRDPSPSEGPAYYRTSQP